MKKTEKLLLFLGLIFFGCTTCNQTPELPCTEEFRFVTIRVNGEPLNDFFTIRTATEDTIRHTKEFGLNNNEYVILTDNYQKYFQNSVENFIFQGFIGDSLVVNEPFVIKADLCHIDYVSGKIEVNL